MNCCETWSGDPSLNPRKNCASVLGARHTARARRTASTCTTLMTIAGDRSIGRFMARFTAMSGATLIYLRWKTASPPLLHPSIATLPEDEPRGLLRSVRTLRRPPHLTHLTPTTQQQSRTHARRTHGARAPAPIEATAAAGRVDRTCVAPPPSCVTPGEVTRWLVKRGYGRVGAPGRCDRDHNHVKWNSSRTS